MLPKSLPNLTLQSANIDLANQKCCNIDLEEGLYVTSIFIEWFFDWFKGKEFHWWLFMSFMHNSSQVAKSSDINYFICGYL